MFSSCEHNLCFRLRGCDFELHDYQLHAFAETTGITLRLHAGGEPDTSSVVRPRVVVSAVSGAVTPSPDARQTQAITSMIMQRSEIAVFREQELVIKSFAQANNDLSQFLEIMVWTKLWIQLFVPVGL